MITKKILAETLKQLLEEKPFSKISVSDIYETCHMNRKSFYYHFKDKYDLVNWIFDNEFIVVIHPIHLSNWDILYSLCTYFYENKKFYQNALNVKEQNSFSKHFHDLLYNYVHTKLLLIIQNEKVTDFQVNFFSDAAIMTFQRWILSDDDISPIVFMTQLKSCLKMISQNYQVFEINSNKSNRLV